MAEYIERKALIHHLENCIDEVNNTNGYTEDFKTCLRLVKNQPAADVAEVKHGKWIGKQLDNFRKYEVTCSNCDWIGIENYDSYDNPFEFNYCPNCGANIDLED